MTTFKVGFHVNSTGGHRGALGDYMRLLDAAGIPFVINAVEDAGLAMEAAQYTNADHVILFHKNVWTGAPNYNADANEEGIRRWQLAKANMPPELVEHKGRIIFEIGIELDKNRSDWLGRFFVAVATAANAAGYKVAGPSLSTGEPEPEHWETPGMLAWLRYLAQHPGQAYFTAHEYSLDSNDIKKDSPWLLGRYKQMYAACDKHGIDRPQVIISECGWAHNKLPGGDLAVMEQIAWAAELYGNIPFALWTLGSGKEWGDLPQRLSAYVDDVTDWIVKNVGPEEEQGMDLAHLIWSAALASKRISHNPQAALGAAILADGNWPLGPETDVTDGDGATYRLQLGKNPTGDVRRAYFVKVPKWGEVFYVEDAGDVQAWNGDGPAVWLDVPYLSQWTPDANNSSGDCGPACVAMIANFYGHDVTVNQAAVACGQSPGSDSASISQLRKGLDFYNVENEFHRPASLDYLRQQLTAGNPMILLIHYGSLEGNQDTFTGGHFFVAVGYGTDDDGDYFLVNDSNFWGNRIEDGNHRRIAANVLARAMDDAVRDGNYARQVIVATGKADAPDPPAQPTIDMAQYFYPRSGGFGDIIILANNWGQGDERQQLQREGDTAYVTKNAQYERRAIGDDAISLTLDTSPGAGMYYTVESSTGWMPRHWRPGESFQRRETAHFFRKSDCRPSGGTLSGNNELRFVQLHERHTTRGGITFENVAEVHWIRNGAIEERYWYGVGLGLIAWWNRHGRESWATEVIPLGQQGNNSREVIPCL